TSRQKATDTPRKHRHVMVQIFLKKRVIGRDAWHACAACEARSRIVRDEWSVDMHHVHVTSRNTRERPIQMRPTHPAVFRIFRYAGSWDTQNARLIQRSFIGRCRPVVTGHYE